MKITSGLSGRLSDLLINSDCNLPMTTFLCKLLIYNEGEVKNMKVIIASDHGGFNLKNSIVRKLQDTGVDITDFGPDSDASVDYPDFARPVAEKVASGEYDRGILICGTGIGMSITANKVKNIRCALVHDTFSAKATRAHNDSNMLAMGERVIGPGLADDIVDIWLDTEYEGGRHERRVCKIEE